MPRLVREKRVRYFDTIPRANLKRRGHSPLARLSSTPLQLLLLVAIGAGVAQFVPNLLQILLNFGTILVVGVVGYFIWHSLRR